MSDCVEHLRKYRELARDLQAKNIRLQEEMMRYLPVIERCENLPALWNWCTKGTGIATANGYRAALKGDKDSQMPIYKGEREASFRELQEAEG